MTIYDVNETVTIIETTCYIILILYATFMDLFYYYSVVKKH